VAKTHLNYYRNKAEEAKAEHSQQSTTLDVAIIRNLNELLECNQRYKSIGFCSWQGTKAASSAKATSAKALSANTIADE
jgi:hypothetical protein